MLEKTFSWRKTFNPEKLRLKDLKYADKQMIYQYGMDKEGHPVQYIIVKNDDLENNEENIKEKFKLLVYSFEMCVRQMQEPVINVVNVVELEGASLSISMARTLKGMFDELGVYYTERTAKIIVLNAGWTISIIWSFLKSFLPQHVIEKYIFIGGDREQIRKELLKYIDESQLALYGKDGDLNVNLELMTKREKEVFGDSS